MKNINLNKLYEIALKAWEESLKIHDNYLLKKTHTQYNQKADNSPVTELDLQIHALLCENLQAQSYYPVFSEESDSVPTKESEIYWLIDPIDGTKEFIKGLDEYTVNIALIVKGKPVIGLIEQPKTQVLYSAVEGTGAFKNGNKIYSHSETNTICVSRSHLNALTEKFIASFKDIQLIKMGSSIKFCLVAEGVAFVYPRLGPINEWDFAAADIILNESGALLLDLNTLERVSYSHRLHSGVIACTQDKLKIIKECLKNIQKLI